MRFACETVVKDFLVAFRHRLIKALVAGGWTQQHIAATLGITQAAVSTYLKKELDAAVLAISPSIDDIVSEVVHVLDSGEESMLPSAMDVVCRACKAARMPGQIFCTNHSSAIPALKQASCDICSRYLAADAFPLNDERGRIVEDLLAAFNRLRFNQGFIELIPEVQSNLVLGYTDPSRNSILDYAAFPGRIIKVGQEAVVAGTPSFGASRHISQIMMIVREKIPSIRCATCIAYNERVATMIETAGFCLVQIEDETDPASLRRAINAATGNHVDAIVFTGAVGKEPITYILGDSTDEIVAKVQMLLGAS
jgi:hypothetical protein